MRKEAKQVPADTRSMANRAPAPRDAAKPVHAVDAGDRNPCPLSFIFATFNGEETLPGVLEGYCAQKGHGEGWRLVIVDNASTDRTAQIIDSFCARLPIVHLHCPDPGKNRALNCALATLGGHSRLCVFTDDDAIPRPGFVAAWERVAAAPGCERRIFGGKVLPRFPAGTPGHVWDHASRFAELYAENTGRTGFEARDIYGPNMAVPGLVFERAARFDETIGPNSSDGDYPMGSETEFCTRIADAFELEPVFVGDAAVDHVVREKQTSMAFIRARAFRHGRGHALQLRLHRGTLPLLRQAAGLLALDRRSVHSDADRLWNAEWRRGFLSEVVPFAGRTSAANRS